MDGDVDHRFFERAPLKLGGSKPRKHRVALVRP
jgi:hypothetical protein